MRWPSWGRSTSPACCRAAPTTGASSSPPVRAAARFTPCNIFSCLLTPSNLLDTFRVSTPDDTSGDVWSERPQILARLMCCFISHAHDMSLCSTTIACAILSHSQPPGQLGHAGGDSGPLTSQAAWKLELRVGSPLANNTTQRAWHAEPAGELVMMADKSGLELELLAGMAHDTKP